MPLLARLKNSLESKIASYEAIAGLAICASIAAFFLLAAAVAWLTAIVGFIQASLIFCGIFVLFASGFWIYGRVKSKEATDKLTTATQGVSNTIQIASKTMESLVATPPTVGKTDLLLAGALIIVLLFAGTWRSQRNRFGDL